MKKVKLVHASVGTLQRNRWRRILPSAARRTFSAVTALALLLVLAGTALLTPAVYAASTFTVTKTADTNDGTCNADCSLREALVAANAVASTAGSPHTINVPAGIYDLTLGELKLGTRTAGVTANQGTNLIGAGASTTCGAAGTTCIRQTDAGNRVLNIDPSAEGGVSVSISGVTITGGHDAGDVSGGAGIIDGTANSSKPADNLTLSNCVIMNNVSGNGTSTSRPGGGLQASNGDLSITNCIFSNNSSGSSSGGGVWFNTLSPNNHTLTIVNTTFTGNSLNNTAISGPIAGGGLFITGAAGSNYSITGSTFTNNTVTGSGSGTTVGGGLYVNTGTLTVSKTTFTGNQASGTGGQGGAIYVESGSANMSLSRLVGNTASGGGGGLYNHGSNGANTTAQNNWWGCNGGPGGAGCDTAASNGGTLTTDPRIVLTNTASPNPIQVNQTTTFTADFLHNSSGGVLTAAQISVLIGLPVSWSNAVRGTLSGAQTSIQANGTATATFTANAAGAGSADAKVDNGTTTGSITIDKADTTTVLTSDTPDPSVTGQAVVVTFSVTSNTGSVPTAPTGTVTVSDGTDSCTGTLAAGQCTITFTSAGAKSLTATYNGDSNFKISSSTPATPHTVNKADTTTTITADNPDPSVVGQAVTIQYQVSVNAPGGGTPTGTVTVSDGTQSCTGTVAAGQCTIAFTSTGAKSLTATYAGDSNYNGSTSASVSHQVNKADTTTTITADNPDPSAVGQAVTVQYSVTVNSPGSGTPTGSVTVSDGVDSCTATVAAGQCNITLTTSGSRTLTATYAGDSNYNGSTSAGEPHSVNKTATTTAITSDTPDPSVVGQAVTIQYSVTPAGSGTPTGNVTVTDGTQSCTGTVAAGQCTITFTTIGAKSLTATYAGDSTFDGSTSAAEPHQVNKADTTTTITSDTPDPSVVGQAVTIQYSVAVNSPGSGTPTGNVTVTDGTQSCTGTVGAGQCTITFTSTGAKSLTATYAGDSNFNGSTSAAESHQVNKANTTTTITADNPDPSLVGQAVTVQYSVAANSPGSGTPTGNVTVSDGTDSCTGTVAAGQCIITFTSGGSKTLTATYAGDSNFNGSTSAGEPHSVGVPPTTTTITSDTPDPSVVGQAVTIQYSVTPTGSGTPTGNVTVTDGTQSCTGTVAAGQCTITFTSAGAKSLTATYAGDSNFGGSTSAAEPHQVNKADTTTTITSDTPDPSVVGQPVTIQYSVAVSSPGSGTPTGNVTVSDGTQSCTGTVAAGQCTITFTSAGAKSLTATYAGDSNFNGSASAAEPHQVNKANTTTTITSDTPDPSAVGQAVTVQYSVAVSSPGSGTPTGNVTVSDGVDSCTATVAAGQCNITLTTPGSRTLTATYAGDSNFNGSTSAGAPHTVNQRATITTITSDTPDPSAVGQAVVVQYTVVPASGSGTPTGNVTVSDGVNSCTGTVAAGQCTITLTTPGNRTLTATYAGDTVFGGSISAGVPHTVNAPVNSGAQLVTDPCNPNKTTLVVSGTTGNDKIEIKRASGGKVQPVVNNVSLGTFSPTGRIIVLGQEGNDTIKLDDVGLPSILYGNDGKDSIEADDGSSILIGGAGDDTLKAEDFRDILIGGTGADKLAGQDEDDILIAGSTSYDAATNANQVALCAIQSEWTRTDLNYQGRINHLNGTTGGGLNGANLLKATSPGQTVFDDSSKDTLTGGSGQDWFLLNRTGGGTLDTSDRSGSEIATDL